MFLDLAYAEIYFGDQPPPSILHVSEAKDITIEFMSISKIYNMPGWRIGFAAGDKKLIGALPRNSLLHTLLPSDIGSEKIKGVI
ncbi:MAG: aminotransferase class I/II-fold pyridoxal phosphate-dependent enzyme, partial [Sneathiella sp.]